MPADFQTFGPYAVPERQEGVGTHIDELFSAIEESKGLGWAVGVYIVAKQLSNGKLISDYVGKTDHGFSKRIKSHHTTLFSGEHRDLKLFIMARVSPTRRSSLAPRKSGKPRYSIDYVESLLIDEQTAGLSATALRASGSR